MHLYTAELWSISSSSVFNTDYIWARVVVVSVSWGCEFTAKGCIVHYQKNTDEHIPQVLDAFYLSQNIQNYPLPYMLSLLRVCYAAANVRMVRQK